MIDKIELFLYEGEYVLSGSTAEYFQPARLCYAGEEKMHQSANGDIRCYIGKTYFGQNRLKVIFSVTKIQYIENNIGILSKEEVEGVIKKVEVYFKRIGVVFDIKRAIVSRLELKRDILLDHPFELYSGVFNYLHMHGRNIITNTYWVGGRPNGIKTGNSTHELSLYNKGAEAQTGQDNLARFEFRMKRQAAVMSDIQVRTVNDLINNYTYLKGQYINLMKAKIFRCDVDNQLASNTTVRNHFETLKYFMEHSRRGMQKFGVFIGFSALVDEMGGETQVRQALQDVRYCSLARIDRMLKEFRREYNLVQTVLADTPTISILYHEIKTKVLDDSGVVYKPAQQMNQTAIMKICQKQET